jgi:protein phosphatase
VNGLPTDEAAPGDSAAARAAAAPGGAREQPSASPTVVAGERRGRGRGGWRGPLLVVLLAVAVLGGIVGAGLAYARSQYYVAADGGEIVIFRGVTGSFGGIELSQVHERTRVAVAALSAFERERVEQGIDAGTLRQARGIVSRLREQACAPARPRGPVATPGPTAPRPSPPRPTPAPTGNPCLVGTAG